jgi:Carboxypeptidase regulatory-like domain
MYKVPALLLVLLLSLYPCALRAQTTNASITGRVTDPSKAVIAEAKVAAVNTGTNFRYESTTNTAGEYARANLPPGTYRIEVEKSGFKKLVRPDVILHVQDALAIDFEMAVGSVSDSITVQAGAPLVNTTSATVSTVVNQTFVENMPLNGRSFQTLIMLTPGVVVTQTAPDDQGQFSVNGQRADANYFTVDGVSANFGVTGYGALVQAAGGALPALTALGGTNSLVSVDAMQEFRVQASSFAPEFMRTPGGEISIVTRSGSNQFHGTAFEYFRNDVLDANDWFSNRDHLPKPEERQNDFGGVFGGPILKDRAFFFFSYEGLRLRQPVTQETVVPDAASRQDQTAGGIAIRPYLNAYPMPLANAVDVGPGLAPFNGS